MTITARHYDSAAEMLSSAHAVRTRLMKPKNAFQIVRALPAPASAIAPPVAVSGPLWKQKPIHFDAHIRRWEWQLANKGGDHRQFIARRCKELGLKYSDFVGSSRRFEITGKRQIIWYELRSKFNLSYPQIGALCGDRDHTSIMSGIKRVARIMDMEIPESVSDRAWLMDDGDLNSRMRQEYAKGVTQAQLAEKFGLAEGAIQKVIRMEKWPRESQDVAKRYDLTGIFDAYYGGWPIKKITKKFGLPERTLQGLRQRFGWAKRDAHDLAKARSA